MKNRILFFISICCFVFSVQIQAQTVVPNADFEEWANGKPLSWDAANFDLGLGQLNTTFQETDDVQSGNSAVRMVTTQENIPFAGPVVGPGTITLGKINLDIANNTATVTGGIAVSGRPVYLTGYFKYTPVNNDRATLGLGVAKWNGTNSDTLGMGTLLIDQTFTDWTVFVIPIEYTSTEDPDSLNIVFTSSDVENEIMEIGSTLLIDNISLEYGPVSVMGFNKSNPFSIYSDAAGQLKLDLHTKTAGKYNLAIYTINGSRVFQKTLHGTASSSHRLPKQTPGIYIVELVDLNAHHRYTQKIKINP